MIGAIDTERVTDNCGSCIGQNIYTILWHRDHRVVPDKNGQFQKEPKPILINRRRSILLSAMDTLNSQHVDDKTVPILGVNEKNKWPPQKAGQKNVDQGLTTFAGRLKSKKEKI